MGPPSDSPSPSKPAPRASGGSTTDRVPADRPSPDGTADVLVVDDDVNVREMIVRALESRGYAVRTASNGATALQQLKECSFRLVITDIYMPDCDGLEVIMRLSAVPAPVPVLAISGGGQFTDPAGVLRSARFLGCDAVLMKPFELEEFLASVERLLDRS